MRLSETIARFVDAEARSGKAPEDGQARTLAYRQAAEAAVREMGSNGRVVLVAEAVLSSNVPDATAELEQRVAAKLRGKKLPGVMNRLTVAQPVLRDDRSRPASVPESVLQARAAADASAEPAKIGYSTILVPDLHSDRRCENGPVQDDSMGLIKLVKDNGQLLAVLVNYAMHGTIIANDQNVLSSDAPGAIESGIEERLSDNAPVLYFQSWAGDMSPEEQPNMLTNEGNFL